MNKKVSKEVIEELQRIGAAEGLKASNVVKSARSKSSPLHAQFEWDDTKAGHEYRLQQARGLIRIAVPCINGKSDPWVHVPAMASKNNHEREGTYYPMSVVVANEDWFARAMHELVGKVRAAQSSAESLRDAATSHDDPSNERMAKIALAITALQTAGAAVSAIH